MCVVLPVTTADTSRIARESVKLRCPRVGGVVRMGAVTSAPLTTDVSHLEPLL